MIKEKLTKHFGDPNGFSRISNTLTRLYTQLDGFDATTVGLYAYLRSWRNTRDEKMRGIVWHSREYLYAQSGLGRKAFEARLRVLKKYGLIDVVKSPVVPNKDYFVVHDPLTRDEFIEKYPAEVELFFKTAEEIEAKNLADREKRQQIARDKLAEVVQLSHLRRAARSNVQNGTDHIMSDLEFPF
jgi:replication initiation and membrane attachment protein DnaB